jgi:hypothetical protein
MVAGVCSRKKPKKEMSVATPGVSLRPVSFEEFRNTVKDFIGGEVQFRGGVFEYKGTLRGLEDGAILAITAVLWKKWFTEDEFLPYLDNELGIIIPVRAKFCLINSGDTCYISLPNTAHVYLNRPISQKPAW